MGVLLLIYVVDPIKLSPLIATIELNIKLGNPLFTTLFFTTL
jgi:hypothetical protein